MNSERVIANKDRQTAESGPAAPTAGPPDHEVVPALAECRRVRRSIQCILHYAKRGAHDLHSGLSLSNNLERFEALSVEQARNLAKFPICSEDRHFGPAVQRAKAAFIDFRETVRREAISILEPQIQEAHLTELLALLHDKSNISVEELEALERALSTRTPD